MIKKLIVIKTEKKMAENFNSAGDCLWQGDFKIKIVSFSMRYNLSTLITASIAPEQKKLCIIEVMVPGELERR